MQNLRSFNVTYVGPTNTKPAKVRVYDNRHQKTVFVPYNDSTFERTDEIAQEFLASKGIITTFISQDKKGFILLTSNFKDQIK